MKEDSDENSPASHRVWLRPPLETDYDGSQIDGILTREISTPEGQSGKNMKTVANLGSIYAAQALKLKLGSAGIEAFIPDEMSAGLAPHHFMNPSGVRLQVADADEEQARKIIEDGFDLIDPIDAFPPDNEDD